MDPWQLHRCSLISLIAIGIALLSGCGGMASAPSSSGVKPAAGLVASSPTLSFGSVANSGSSDLTDSLTNASSASVTISAANISGAGFSVSGLTLPISLAPNASVTFTVTFAPVSSGTSTGTASGRLAIVSTAGTPTLDIALSASEMTQGQLSVSPPIVSFGNVVVGAGSSLSGTLQATGSAVTISAASSSSNEFALSGLSLPTTLAAGDSTSFAVTFTPSATGSATGSLSFSSNAANSPTVQSLTGAGAVAAQHSVGLTWEVSVASSVVGYNVYRGSVSGGPYTMINSTLEASTAYTDNDVALSETYYYVTTAVTGSGEESGYSNEVNAVIPSS